MPATAVPAVPRTWRSCTARSPSPSGTSGPARQHDGHRSIAGVAHADHEPAKQNEEEVRDEPAQQTADSLQAGHEGDIFLTFVHDEGKRQHEQGHTAEARRNRPRRSGSRSTEGFLHGGNTVTPRRAEKSSRNSMYKTTKANMKRGG